jgi:hypothetical protein
VVSGTATSIITIAGAVPGNYTVTFNGATVTVAGPNGSGSGTTGNTTATDIGLSLNAATTTTMEFSSLSVKSN